MRVGLVCPFSWDVPSGVAIHVQDLAENLIALGHEVQVLAPGDDDSDVPDYVTLGWASGSNPVQWFHRPRAVWTGFRISGQTLGPRG